MKNHKFPETLALKNKKTIHYVGNVHKFLGAMPYEDDYGQKYIVDDCTIDDYKAYHKLTGHIMQIDWDSHNYDFGLYAIQVEDFSSYVKKNHGITE
jgi:hypothetical protein